MKTILVFVTLALALTGCGIKLSGEFTMMERWDKRPKQTVGTQTVNTNVVETDDSKVKSEKPKTEEVKK